MDSVLNGEVSEESLSKTKETGNISAAEGTKETKHVEETIIKTEISELAGDSASSPTHETSSKNGGASNLKETPPSCISSDSTVHVDCKTSQSASEVNTATKEDISSEGEKSSVLRENGILNSANLPGTDDMKCNRSSNISTKVGSNASSNLLESPDDAPRDLVSPQPSKNMESSKSLVDSKLLATCDKTGTDSSSLNVIALEEESDEDENTELNNQNLKVQGTNDIKNDLVTAVDEPKNHFMEEGSEISCNDQIEDQRPDPKNNSEISGVEEIRNSSDISSNNESKVGIEIPNNPLVNRIQACTEQPLNFATMKSEQITSNQTPGTHSHTNTYDINNLVDLTVNKWPQENPLEKLSEHLKNIGADKEQIPFNHTQKGHVCPTSASLPREITTKTDSHAACDKEHKNNDPLSHERSNKESSDSFVYAELSKEETGFPDVFAGLVTIGKYISVKGDFTLRSTEALVESPSLVAPYLLKEPDTFPPKEKDSKSEVRDFFHSAAGEILIGIGISRVNEWFHRDMVRIKKRQMKKSGKTPQLEEDLKMHENFFIEAKKANSVYSFTFKSCKTCGFTSESSIVMEGHLLVPHITQRREYQCNFCESINRDPKGMLEHMANVHGKVGRIQPPVLFFECPYCSFESNSKVKLNNHLAKCQRYFDHGINQAPPKDFEFPALTPKPITVAVVKAYEKSLGSMQRGRGRPKKDISESLHMNQFSNNANLPPLAPNHLPTFRASSNSPLADSLSVQNQIIPPIQMPNMNIRPAHASAMGQLRPAISHLHMPPPNRFFHFVNPSGQLMPLMGNNHLVTSSSQFPFSPSIDSSGTSKKSSASNFNSMLGSNLRQQNSSKAMSSVTITPLPKLQGPYPVPMAKPSTASGSTSMQSNSLVVCEICDGYIKDLEQLRTHMQLIHKVKIHPKMLVSRPPLNCQKCQWRFFTDQGLERHLLGAHGLVTSNMQELANKGKDAGCCTICGRVYASKLVSHMNQVHKITLKPAHLSYKCTVCSATFNLYRLFENHVYLVHSGAAKRSADGRSSPSKRIKASSDSLADVEPSNHKEKSLLKDVGDENINKCKTCGSVISNDNKSQSEKCEKCLKSDELVHGTLSTKTLQDELRQKDKTIEKAAA